MAKNCEIVKPFGAPMVDDFYNDTGATLAQFEFTVLGEKCVVAVAADGIANAARGSCDFGCNQIRIFTAGMASGEATFNTDNQIVYFDPSAKKFSDTEKAGYYAVGQLTVKKGSTGFCEFKPFDRAILVTT